jgi:hypothetical protein
MRQCPDGIANQAVVQDFLKFPCDFGALALHARAWRISESCTEFSLGTTHQNMRSSLVSCPDDCGWLHCTETASSFALQYECAEEISRVCENKNAASLIADQSAKGV